MTPNQFTTRLLCIALCLALASCATVPRAIIPPPSVIEELDVAPVAEAGKATREAVRHIGSAGQASREAGRKVSDSTRRLTESLARAEALAAANAEITAALADTRRLAVELEASVADLSAALAFAEEREKIAIEAVDDMGDIIARLQSETGAQSAQIRFAKDSEKVIREQVETLSALPEKLAKSEQKSSTLEWWVWRLGFLAVVMALIIATLAYLLIKP